MICDATSTALSTLLTLTGFNLNSACSRIGIGSRLKSGNLWVRVPPRARMKLTKSNPNEVMTWVTIVDNEIEWHASQEIAEGVAIKAMQDAKEGKYHVTVFVLQCKKQGNVP